MEDSDKEKILEILDEELAFLAKKVIPQNAWETYTAFNHTLHWWGYEKHEKRLCREIDKQFRAFCPVPPESPDELFGDNERNPEFLHDKINFLHKELLVILTEMASIKNNFLLFKERLGYYLLGGLIIIILWIFILHK